MPDRQLGDAARVPGSTIPISTVLHLTSEGLVLGAGTLLVAADAARRLSSLRGQEARVLALLSAGYNRAVPPSVLGNIERAAKSWRDGDDLLVTSILRMRVCPNCKSRTQRHSGSSWPTN